MRMYADTADATSDMHVSSSFTDTGDATPDTGDTTSEGEPATRDQAQPLTATRDKA